MQYFTELFRVSKNQIIWGANYFTQYLPSSMGWIFWDKGQDLSMSDGELAFSSYDKALRRIKINRGQLMVEGGTIHPTQKPIKLYDFCFQFAKVEAGAKILDTHLGSGSSRISANKNKLNFVGCEIDKEYYDNQNKRYDDFVSQLRLF
jgi:site-specific DNA-methyltransferase (adenine-specific)